MGPTSIENLSRPVWIEKINVKTGSILGNVWLGCLQLNQKWFHSLNNAIIKYFLLWVPLFQLPFPLPLPLFLPFANRNVPHRIDKIICRVVDGPPAICTLSLISKKIKWNASLCSGFVFTQKTLHTVTLFNARIVQIIATQGRTLTAYSTECSHIALKWMKIRRLNRFHFRSSSTGDIHI